MPLFEFHCPGCGTDFEILRKTPPEGPEPCPDCGAPAERVVSACGVIFKGTGFYATDHGDRRPGSFLKDGKGTIKGKNVAVPKLAGPSD